MPIGGFYGEQLVPEDLADYLSKPRTEQLPTLQDFFQKVGASLPTTTPEAPMLDETTNAALYPGMEELKRNDQLPNVTDFSSEMGKRQKLDESLMRHEAAPQSLENVYEQSRAQQGYTNVPGTKSFMQPGTVGNYRAESGVTPEGARATAAADSLRARNKAAYGGSGKYGASADWLNSMEGIYDAENRTQAATVTKRQELSDAVNQIQRQLVTELKNPNSNPQVIENLKQRYAQLNALSTQAEAALSQPHKEALSAVDEALKPLNAMNAQQQQRDEYGQLAQMLAGGKIPGMPGGMSKETYGELGSLIKSQHEQHRLDNSDIALGLRGQSVENSTNRANAPHMPNAALVEQTAKTLLPAGLGHARVAGRDYIYKAGSNTPEKNSDQIWSTAIQQAQRQLMSQSQANPAVVNNPGVQEVKKMLDAEANQTLNPAQGVLLQRFKTNYNNIKQTLIKGGVQEEQAKQQAMILASGDVTGLR